MDYNFQVKEFGERPEEPKEIKPSPNFLNKIIASGRYLKWVIGLILILILIGVAAFFFGRASFRERNLEFSIEAQEEAVSGDEVEYKIKINNNNKASLETVKLIVFYPEESLVFDEEGNQLISLVEEIGLEDLGSGEIRELTKKALLIGKPGDLRTARFRLNFRPKGVTTVFEKETRVKTTISKVPVSLSLFVPPNVFSDQEITILFDYRNETEDDLNDLRIKFNYPDGLKLARISPSPTSGNNIWDIPTLKSDRGKRIEISGAISGREKEVKAISAVLQKRVLGKYLDFGKISAQSVISSPLLSLEILLKNSREHIAVPGEGLRYKIKFSNSSKSNLSGLSLRAKLDGSMFEFATIDAGSAFFDQNSRTILWNASVMPLLGNLGPGQAGEVDFAVSLKQDVSGEFQKDISLRVSADIESSSIPADFTGDKITAKDELITRISTIPGFEALAYYSDPSWSINIGPHPPQVGQKTTYTIHWLVSTTTSDLTNVRIRSSLFPGVSWEDKVKVNFGEAKPEYNSTTGEVSWEIPQVPAGIGTTLSKYEAIFQVSVTPSINQVGQPVELLQFSEFSAVDSFTKNEIFIRAGAITTSGLTNQSGGGIIQP